ncbi:FAS-associated factor 1-like [Drosophila bipectinata]|uniref:FAS-associated factor 1-like n=1 Tax=Drosophila bipectinata TaxID=42026 RepID=UPI001C8A1034|nr:FAS-associated factor 1-like [Drosophila bipectinata]
MHMWHMWEHTRNNQDMPENIRGSSMDEDMSASDDDDAVLKFNVKYGNLRKKIYVLREKTVAALQQAIFGHFNVHPKYQILCGCGLVDADSDEVSKKPLNSLSLSSNNCIDVADKYNKITIEIQDETNNKTITLRMSNSTTVQELKHNFYCITNIPVRFQEWSEFPKVVHSDTPLWKAGFGSVEKVLLKVSRSEDQSQFNTTSSADEAATDSETDSDLDNDGSESDTISLLGWKSTNVSNSSSENSLIGNDPTLVDLHEGTTLFVQNYKLRFGEPMIDFYIGDLRDAFKETFVQTENKKLLAIYLHHCDSILTNIFCHNVLKNEMIQWIFKKLFIVYGWDLTKETKGESHFFNELKDVISPNACTTAENMCLDKLPAFLMVRKEVATKRTFISVVHGDLGVEELQTRLLEQYELLTGLD